LLVEDVLTNLTRPDRVTPVIRGFLIDTDSIPRAECGAAMAGNTIAGVHPDCITVVSEHTIGAVFHATPAEHALVGIDLNFVAEGDTTYRHAITLPMTGSPAFGIVIASTSGSIRRIAASSLEI